MTEISEVVDLAEDLANQTDDIWLLFTYKDKKGLIASGLAIVSGVALAAGTTGYLVAKKLLEPKYAQLAKEEIEEAKDFYARLYKKDDFETPETAAEVLGVNAAAEALGRYQGNLKIEHEEVEVEVDVVPATVPETRNIFTQNSPEDPVWDLEKEIANRTDDEPYIISQDEFGEGERDYKQITLTYFDEDDVLVDEEEKPIEASEVDNVVGEGNLTRFGHGSNDNRIVYIRNDRLSLDFEVIKNQGSYSKEVLGFQHGDGVGRKAQMRKFRVSDE